jgi:hypothetical protein
MYCRAEDLNMFLTQRYINHDLEKKNANVRDGRMTEGMENRAALVTGSGSGIGRGVALVFAREGAKAVVTGINSEGGLETVEMITKEGGDAIFIKADLLQSSRVEK